MYKRARHNVHIAQLFDTLLHDHQLLSSPWCSVERLSPYNHIGHIKHLLSVSLDFFNLFRRKQFSGSLRRHGRVGLHRKFLNRTVDPRGGKTKEINHFAKFCFGVLHQILVLDDQERPVQLEPRRVEDVPVVSTCRKYRRQFCCKANENVSEWNSV